MKTTCRVLLAACAACAAVWGAGFWEKTKFTHWSGKEVQKMLTNSPWAKRVTVPLGTPMAGGLAGGGGGRGGGGRGGGGGGGIPGGGGGGGGGRRGGGGGNTSIPIAPTVNLTVRFRSALPVKQSLVKGNMGESTELTPEMNQFLDREETHYVVAVDRLPQQLSRMSQNPDALIGTAVLRRKGKADLAAEKVEVQAGGQVTRFYYFFPRTEEITLADKEVEFFMKLQRPGGTGQRGGGRAGREGGQGAGGRAGGAGGGPGAGGRAGGAGGGPGAGGRAGGGAGGPGAGGGRGGGAAFALFGKEIKRKFKLKDMVYNGTLAL